jgi:hypothetical protein
MPAKPVVIDDVEYATREAAAQAWNVPVTTFVRRLNEGFTPSEAVRVKCKGVKSVSVEGKVFRSIAEAAKFYNINYGCFQARLVKGWTAEEAAGVVQRKLEPKKWRETGATVTVAGVKYGSLTSAAKQRGFTYSCVKKRVDNGLTIAQAFEVEPFPEWFTPGKGQFAVKKKEDRIKKENKLGARQCSLCKRVLPLMHFSKYSYRKEHDYYYRCKECISHDFLMYRYGITAREFVQLGDLQGWLCAVCNNSLNMQPGKVIRTKSVAVDHCHSTGVVRGLLCSFCNRGLGSFKDSVENLTRAIEYLNHPPAPTLK